jgi:hypothetical protein
VSELDLSYPPLMVRSEGREVDKKNLAFIVVLACSVRLVQAQTPSAMQSDAVYHQIRGGLKNSVLMSIQEKRGQVTFLGGSITENPGWRDSICCYLQDRFPDTRFEFVPAGIASTGSTLGAFRLQNDVLSKGTIDLLFEEAAVNDYSNGFDERAQIRGTFVLLCAHLASSLLTACSSMSYGRHGSLWGQSSRKPISWPISAMSIGTISERSSC